MNTLFENELSLADTNFASINTKFMEAVTESVETGLITEAQQDSLIVKAKKFFADLISAMETFIKSIKSEVERKVVDKTNKLMYKKMYNKIKNETEPHKRYTVPDDKAVLSAYKSAVNRLDKYVKNFANKEYKLTSEIDSDINRFNYIYDECEKEIESAIKKTKEISGSEYIKYIERNMTGYDSTISQISEYKGILDQLRISCDRAETRYKILGPDILSKKIGFLRKIGMRISAFFRKWIAKVISTIVFIFA